MEALTHDMPAEVSEFIFRMVECSHWAGEEPFDEQRAVTIRQAVERLRCEAIDQDESSLRGAYEVNPRVLRAIDEAKQLAF
jgi:hypothetical protein